MSTSYYRRDVEALIPQLHTTAVAAGVIPEHTVIGLQPGSPTYGRGWRIVSIGDYRLSDEQVAAQRKKLIDLDDMRPGLHDRLVTFDRYPRGTGHYSLPFGHGNGYLGNSAREAYLTLYSFISAFRAVVAAHPEGLLKIGE